MKTCVSGRTGSKIALQTWFGWQSLNGLGRGFPTILHDWRILCRCSITILSTTQSQHLKVVANCICRFPVLVTRLQLIACGWKAVPWNTSTKSSTLPCHPKFNEQQPRDELLCRTSRIRVASPAYWQFWG